MGIESDQLVYDYLSRVGDVAQQQQLSSGVRMRLVSTLRSEIDRQRGTQSADTPAAVRRIIGRLGTPDELVAAAAASAGGAVELPQQPDPAAGAGRGIPRPRPARTGMLRKDGFGKGASRARAEGAEGPAAEQEPAAGSTDPANSAHPLDSADPAAPGAAAGRGSSPGQAPSPPHMAGTDELGPSGGEPDWWRIEPGPFGAGVDVPGFVGGVEIPEMMGQPRSGDTVPHPRTDDAVVDEDDGVPEDGPTEEAVRRRWRPRLGRRAPREGGTKGRGFSHPLLLLAAALLVAGAVLGSWPALAGGWLLAYGSRKLTRTEAKWAVLGLPGVVAAAALVWLWGRTENRWGEPIGDGQMSAVMGQTWPWVVRGAAVASALYLVWRARRPRS
ncbi:MULTISPECIES: hypothetical protein [unclassified Streptomyces]|uniref:hypothetical protein n=1 Tax=unclassified Streptomyces TaxID=2593676 RepID=UPI0036E5D3C2